MKTDTIVRGLQIAATYIAQLGEVNRQSKVPYFLSCMDDEGVELAIAPRTKTEYWKIAKILNVAPLRSDLVVSKRLTSGALVITLDLITEDQELAPEAT